MCECGPPEWGEGGTKDKGGGGGVRGVVNNMHVLTWLCQEPVGRFLSG